MSTSTHPPLESKTRLHLLEEMAAEFNLTIAKAIVMAIADDTDKPCDQVADIIIGAWQRTKEATFEEAEHNAECFEKIIMYP